MVTKITSVTTHETAEGMRASYTYSVIDDDGRLVKSNVRDTCIVMDSDILASIKKVTDYLWDKATKVS